MGPQRPQSKRVPYISEKLDFWWSVPQKNTSIGYFCASDDQTIGIRKFFGKLGFRGCWDQWGCRGHWGQWGWRVSKAISSCCLYCCLKFSQAIHFPIRRSTLQLYAREVPWKVVFLETFFHWFKCTNLSLYDMIFFRCIGTVIKCPKGTGCAWEIFHNEKLCFLQSIYLQCIRQ